MPDTQVVLIKDDDPVVAEILTTMFDGEVRRTRTDYGPDKIGLARKLRRKLFSLMSEFTDPTAPKS